MVQLGLVVAQYDKHGDVIAAMEESAHATAESRDADIVATIEVPGSYDTPLAADRLARRDDIDAVAVLGAIITGDTDHDQVIGDATTQALTQVSLDRDTPVTLGIIGPGMSQDEAAARTHKGGGAVDSAVDLALELQQ